MACPRHLICARLAGAGNKPAPEVCSSTLNPCPMESPAKVAANRLPGRTSSRAADLCIDALLKSGCRLHRRHRLCLARSV